MNAEEILKRYAEGDRDFTQVILLEANLSGANLHQANLTEANLSVANLSGSNLSGAKLNRAKLNVTKLSGANLHKANLTEANLNVANLTLADLSEAEMSQASLIRAEMARADLSGANLSRANLSGADLRDAKLRNAILTDVNLSRADLKWTTLTAANLARANLHATDMSSADFSGADLSNTELRQANLSCTNLCGANLSGANLRWADLSGADLSWADLSEAKLSGANLTGANLTNANLFGTSLVHVDLTRANLMGVDWSGADLSGATLTGAKLYGVLQFGIKTEGMVCDWIDLSRNGDQSDIYRFTSNNPKTFFHEKPPTVSVVIDAPMNSQAHHALAAIYRQVVQSSPIALPPPNLQIGRRRTTLTFEMDSDDQLFMTAYGAILPFGDADKTQKSTIALVKLLTKMVKSSDSISRLLDPARFAQLGPKLEHTLEMAEALKPPVETLKLTQGISFFQASTRTTLINSSSQTLNAYSHPMFGKRLVESTDLTLLPIVGQSDRPFSLPELTLLIDFVKGFHFIGSPTGRAS
jgi:uncharacterized protein YjbI with pentapeptide repeats